MSRLLIAAALCLAGHAASAECVRSDVRGLTRPGGAASTMEIHNTGEPCRARTWADPPTRTEWLEQHVVSAPSHGSVTAGPVEFAYTPARGYAGPDGFSIGSSGRTTNGRPLVGQLQVSVTVLPP